MQLCCIPLRDLRYLRENIHIRVLNQFTNKKPQCLPQISLITQTKPKTTTTSQTVFLCDIMQLAAFLCVICAICGRIHARGLKQSAQMKPQCLPQISQIHADKPQNHKTTLTSPNCLSLRYNAACCIPLRDLRYLRENIHARVLKQLHRLNPSVSRRSRRLSQTKPKTHKTTLTSPICLSLRNNAACCIPSA